MHTIEPRKIRRARAKRRPAHETQLETALILWALRLWGDVNEGYQGGNAREVLRERIKEQGFAVDSSAFAKRMLNLEQNGTLKFIKKGRITYNIRLMKKNFDEKRYPNPYTTYHHNQIEPVEAELVPEIPSGNHVTLNGYQSLSLQQRMVLLDELDAAAKLVRESMTRDLALAQDLFGGLNGQ